MILAYLILMVLILPKSYQLEFSYKVGEAWNEPDLYAPFEFAVYKTKDSIESEEQLALEQVLDIYAPDSAQMKRSRDRIIRSTETFGSQAAQYQRARKEGNEAEISRLTQLLFGGRFSNLNGDILPEIKDGWATELTQRSMMLTDTLYRRGYLSLIRPDSTGPFIAIRTSRSSEVVVARSKMITSRDQLGDWLDVELKDRPTVERIVLSQVLLEEGQPNLVFNDAFTTAEKNRVKALIPPVAGKVFAQQRIIRRGEQVDRETNAIIQSMLIEKEARFGSTNRWNIYIGQFLTLFLITMLLLVYLSVNRPRLYFSLNHLSLILTTLLLAVGGMALAVKLTDIAARVTDTLGNGLYLSYIYLAPVSIVPIFITNFFGHRTGFLCNLLAALYGAVLVERGLEFAFVQIIAGTVAVYSLHQLRKREVFFYTLAYIFLGYAISYIVFSFYSKGDLSSINYGNLMLFGINVVLTVIAYNLIYLFERIFGITSDLTYLELLDTNHPLLQALARKAPGTFQHSLQVANIAEATINVVGGNALLIHVGALYHDVGKMADQKFFIENIPEGGNPHDLLSCQDSAAKIIGHVALGVELAHKHKLPTEIIDFIETHHGTTRVEYFYRKHLMEMNCKPPEHEAQFRYPGPKPFSKETAVLMIADSVEAASRSLVKPTPKSIKELVNNIIDHKIKDNQFENSNLTFKDITAIRKVVTRQLLSIYHSRIEYPKEVEEAVSE